jgi:2,3-bisphosphoglycerate-independent phosphoglycerate mutase
MDRDKRWERIKLAYDALINRKGDETSDWSSAIQNAYKENVTDEFLKPIINKNTPGSSIKDGDAVFCFNFRTDRCREITEVLTQHPVVEFGMNPLSLHYTCMTRYDHTFKNIFVVLRRMI